MSPFLSGFADELVKVANPATRFLERLRESPDLRQALKHSAILGAVTGAVAGGLSKKQKDESRLKKILGGAAIGGATGGITGGAFPGWFAHENHLAPDEHKISRIANAVTGLSRKFI